MEDNNAEQKTECEVEVALSLPGVISGKLRVRVTGQKCVECCEKAYECISTTLTNLTNVVKGGVAKVLEHIKTPFKPVKDTIVALFKNKLLSKVPR